MGRVLLIGATICYLFFRVEEAEEDLKALFHVLVLMQKGQIKDGGGSGA